jgi:hypothetical protein
VSASSTEKPTIRETWLSLTGYEERTILARFGGELEDLAAQRGANLVRALAFIVEKRKRAGEEPASAEKDAFRRAMSLTKAELEEFFAPREDDGDLDLGDDESGEG